VNKRHVGKKSEHFSHTEIPLNISFNLLYKLILE